VGARGSIVLALVGSSKTMPAGQHQRLMKHVALNVHILKNDETCFCKKKKIQKKEKYAFLFLIRAFF